MLPQSILSTYPISCKDISSWTKSKETDDDRIHLLMPCQDCAQNMVGCSNFNWELCIAVPLQRVHKIELLCILEISN